MLSRGADMGSGDTFGHRYAESTPGKERTMAGIMHSRRIRQLTVFLIAAGALAGLGTPGWAAERVVLGEYFTSVY